MPKPKPSASDDSDRSKRTRERLICGESDASWETALIKARSSVRNAIWDICKDSTRRTQSHAQICTAVEAYVHSLTRVEKRKIGGQVVFRREFLRRPLAGVEALERLSRPQAPYALAKAWTELPAVALDALNDACVDLRGEPLRLAVARWPTIAGTFVQVNPVELAQLLPRAITKAQSYGNRDSIRDRAIITMLGEYAHLKEDWPSAKVASRFIKIIENCYREFLPSCGFDVGSDAAIYRLLNRAKHFF